MHILTEDHIFIIGPAGCGKTYTAAVIVRCFLLQMGSRFVVPLNWKGIKEITLVKNKFPELFYCCDSISLLNKKAPIH